MREEMKNENIDIICDFLEIKMDKNDNKEKYAKDKRIHIALTFIDSQILQYMANAIRLYSDENYEDSLANVRRSLELYLYARMDYDNIMLEEEAQLTIFGILDYYIKQNKFNEVNEGYRHPNGYYRDKNRYEDHKDIEEVLKEIRLICNNNVHVSIDINHEQISDSSVSKILKNMMNILIDDYQIFRGNSFVLSELNDRLETYIKRATEFIDIHNVEDALLNIRKVLECVVKGYLKYYHVCCTYGKEKNVSGYIDLLFEKNMISEQSKANLHKIRVFGNEGAHGKLSKIEENKLELIVDTLKEEIEIYKKATCVYQKDKKTDLEKNDKDNQFKYFITLVYEADNSKVRVVNGITESGAICSGKSAILIHNGKRTNIFIKSVSHKGAFSALSILGVPQDGICEGDLIIKDGTELKDGEYELREEEKEKIEKNRVKFAATIGLYVLVLGVFGIAWKNMGAELSILDYHSKREFVVNEWRSFWWTIWSIVELIGLLLFAIISFTKEIKLKSTNWILIIINWFLPIVAVYCVSLLFGSLNIFSIALKNVFIFFAFFVGIIFVIWGLISG